LIMENADSESKETARA